MSFPRYLAYKASGVAWLGEVPAHWGVTKVRHLTDFTTGWTPATGDDAAYVGDNLWANISDLIAKRIDDTAKRISDEAVAKAGVTISPVGSLLFSFKLSIGQVSFANCPMYTNEAIATFRPSEALSLDYAYYAFPFFLVQNAAENIYGAKLLNQQLIRSAQSCLPPREEQDAIAAFLDRETVKIDGLVSEQRRLIELLREKRQAVISHAVTKGLNPDAPMKPSGSEWFREVPKRWRVGSLRHFWEVVDCKHVTVPFTDEGYPLASVLEVREFEVNLSTAERTSRAFYELLVGGGREPKRGDVIYCRNTANTGTSAYLNTDEPVALGQDVSLIKSPDQNGRFLNYVLHSGWMADQLTSVMVGSTFKRVNVAEIKSFVVTCPPREEQDEIAGHLDSQTSRIDSLLAEAERAIGLLTERRAALISAAVTGKIDVRRATMAAGE